MSQCLKYYVKLDGNGAPIQSTMQGFNPKVSNPTCAQTLGCQLVVLQTTPYETPPGMKPCLFPGGIRYFYRIDKKGHIVPNSLMESLEFPVNPGKCGYFIEYKKFTDC